MLSTKLLKKLSEELSTAIPPERFEAVDVEEAVLDDAEIVDDVVEIVEERFEPTPEDSYVGQHIVRRVIAITR